MVVSVSAVTDASDRSATVLPPPGGTSALPGEISRQDHALVGLGQELRQRGYRFTTVTPLTHRRVLARPGAARATLEDIFGWSRPFAEGDLPQSLLTRLADAGLLAQAEGRLRAAVRFSSLGDQLFAHSAFPTEQGDAVFFGPDTYRFARAIAQSIATAMPRHGARILDIGAGSGAGGLHAAALLRHGAPHVTLTDINAGALRFCAINARVNDVANATVAESDLYAQVDGAFDLIISNPPYLVDPLARLYRHGGGELGSALSLRIVEEGIGRLAPGGRLMLYTGSAIVGGVDAFRETLRRSPARPRAPFRLRGNRSRRVRRGARKPAL